MINKDLLPHHLRLALFLVEHVVLHCHFFASIDLRTSVVSQTPYSPTQNSTPQKWTKVNLSPWRCVWSESTNEQLLKIRPYSFTGENERMLEMIYWACFFIGNFQFWPCFSGFFFQGWGWREGGLCRGKCVLLHWFTEYMYVDMALYLQSQIYRVIFTLYYICSLYLQTRSP